MKKIVFLGFLLLTLAACASTTTKKSSTSENLYIDNRDTIKPIIAVTPNYPGQKIQSTEPPVCIVSFDLESDGKFGSKPINIEGVNCQSPELLKECSLALKKWVFRDIKALQENESTDGLLHTCRFN